MSYIEVSGPLKITVEHDGIGDAYPFRRAGPPKVWGRGLEHKTVGSYVIDPNSGVDGVGSDVSDQGAGITMMAFALGAVAFAGWTAWKVTRGG